MDLGEARMRENCLVTLDLLEQFVQGVRDEDVILFDEL